MRRSSSCRRFASTASIARRAPASSSSTATRTCSADSSVCRSPSSAASPVESSASRSVRRDENCAIWPSSRAIPASSDSWLARRDSTRMATSRAALRCSSARARASASLWRRLSLSASSSLRRSSSPAMASMASSSRPRVERLPALATSSALSSSASSAASCCMRAPRCSDRARRLSNCERSDMWAVPVCASWDCSDASRSSMSRTAARCASSCRSSSRCRDCSRSSSARCRRRSCSRSITPSCASRSRLTRSQSGPIQIPCRVITDCPAFSCLRTDKASASESVATMPSKSASRPLGPCTRERSEPAS